MDSRDEVEQKFKMMFDSLDTFVYLKTGRRTFRNYRMTINPAKIEVASIHVIDKDGKQVKDWTADFKDFMRITKD